MASLALGAAGAALGSAFAPAGFSFLGMSAAGLGFNIGSALGGFLFAPKPEDQHSYGPRLSDLKVQASTYGNAIPRVYGTFRLAGNMIWSEAIKETEQTTTQEQEGGKGGGGGASVSQTSYTYSQSFAVALCEGPIVAIKRIWLNGKLVSNLSSSATAATIAASTGAGGIFGVLSGQMAGAYSAQKSTVTTRAYLGSESQTPDALIQANVGAANCPAFRGTAYMVFENLALADYGNSTPNVEVEVVVAGSTLPPSYGSAYSSGEYITNNYARVIGGVIVSHVSETAISGGYRNKVQVQSIDTAQTLGYEYYDCAESLALFDSDPFSGVALIGAYPNYTGFTVFSRGSEIGSVLFPSGYAYGGIALHGSADAGVVVMSYSSPVVTKIAYSIRDGRYAAARAMPNVGKVAVGLDDRMIYAIEGSALNVYDAGFTLLGTWASADLLLPSGGTSKLSAMSGIVAASGVESGISSNITMNQLNSDGSVTQLGACSDALNTGHVRLSATSALTYYYPAQFTARVSSTDPTVAAIVSDLCTDMGLAVGDIDVTDLASDTLPGFVIPRRMTGRAAIEPLMQVFAFDPVESDGAIKFVKRGGSSAAAITEAECAARAYGGAAGDTVQLDRAQEVELPLEVTVVYADSAADYQPGSQYARRLIGESDNKVTIELPMAITATKAKRTADVMLFDAWQARTAFKFSVSRKYAYLEPTDLVTIAKGSASYLVRITGKQEQSGVITLDGVCEDASIYTQSSTGAALQAPADTVGLRTLTKLMLLDIPLLRDQDNGVGFYAAACGYTDNWRGAQIFKSADSGQTWAPYGVAMVETATIGHATTALGNFTQNIFDESGSVTVTLVAGTLSSATEAAVLNGDNLALLGDEIIAFKTATLVSDDTYALTGLLRGRRGTEWARGTHLAGDRFVLLDDTAIRLFTAPSSEIAVSRRFRGVSFGASIYEGLSQDFTYSAIALECLSPVLLGGGRDAAGNLTLNWVRRSRLAGEWTDYADVPLGEDTESYDVDIYTSSGYATVVRTITATSQTCSYTAAQQTTDFGGTQATVYWKVYQLSATVGRGYAGTGAT